MCSSRWGTDRDGAYSIRNSVDHGPAEWLAREVGQVDTEAIKHEAQTETQHPLFAPLTDQWQQWIDQLRFQKPRQAIVSDHAGHTANIWTIPIPPYSASGEQIEAVRQASGAGYGIPYAEALRNVKTSSARQTLPLNVPAYDTST